MPRDTELTSRTWGSRNGERAIVVLHGFGADSSDLAPLGGVLDPPGVWDWHFLRAPLTLQYAGTSYGRAWFPDSPQEMLQALQGDYFSDLAQLDPPGLRRSAEQVLQYVARHNLERKAVFLGGFSQGAMVALEAALQAQFQPGGLFLLSGALIAADRTSVQARARRGCSFVQSHGRADTILPYSAGRALYRTLADAGWQGEFIEFDGGHTVGDEVLAPLAEFLKR